MVTKRKSSARGQILQSKEIRPFYPEIDKKGKDNRGFIHDKDIAVSPTKKHPKIMDNKYVQGDNGSDSCERL